MAALVPVPLSIQLVSGPYEDRTLGASVTAGQAVYLDATDSSVKVADSDASGKKTVRGIALDGGSQGDPCRVALDGSVINLGCTLGVGTPYFLGATAGAIVPLADVGSSGDLDILGAGSTAALFKVHIWNSAIAHA